MKRICIVSVALASIFSLVLPGFGQEKTNIPAADGKGAARPNVSKPKNEGRRHGAFVGSVVWADPGTKTLTVKGRGRIVTFDASNPSFRGYRSLADVREGSYVSVSYTAGGLRISRSSQGEAMAGPLPEEKDSPKAAAKGPAKGSKSRMARIPQKGIRFLDVDENRDGKVTAVEMSVVMTDLTLEQFKGYDRNGDGCLSETEYRAALKSR